MRRREFVRFAGGAAFTWPLAAHAQSKSIPVVGFLGANTPATAGHLTSAFVERLRDLGWVEGQNVSIEYRWAAGQTAKFQELAAELVAAGATVIVTSGDAPAKAARQVTNSVPIVMASSGNILETGLVKSLARPGGNVTGLTVSTSDTAGKRLEMLTQTVAGLSRVAVLFNPDANPGEVTALRELAPSLHVSLEVF